MHNSSKKTTVELGDFWLTLFGIPILGLLMPPLFFHTPISAGEAYWYKAGFSTFYTALYWLSARKIFKYFDRQYPNIEQNKQRITGIMVVCLTFMMSTCNLIHFCLEPYFPNLPADRPDVLQINLATTFSFITIAGIYESKRYFQLLQRALVEKAQLEKENLASQLEGLRNQVNPHFLFNSLNTLINIIPENPETAVRFVQKLSKVYRYILEIRDANTTPLSSELEYLNAYVFLLKERFGDNLSIHIDPRTEGVLDAHIVPLSLQILFENAIKHNVISAEKPLLIDVSVEKNERLIVKNKLQRKNQIQEGTGVGLENIRHRYELVSQQTVEVIVTQQSFIVSLPLLKFENQLVA